MCIYINSMTLIDDLSFIIGNFSRKEMIKILAETPQSAYSMNRHFDMAYKNVYTYMKELADEGYITNINADQWGKPPQSLHNANFYQLTEKGKEVYDIITDLEKRDEKRRVEEEEIREIAEDTQTQKEKEDDDAKIIERYERRSREGKVKKFVVVPGERKQNE